MVLVGVHTSASRRLLPLPNTKVHVNGAPNSQVRRLHPDQCRALRRHEEGRWEHQYFFRRGMGDVGAEARDMYTPLERDWLSGKNQSFRPYVVSGSPACKLHEGTPRPDVYY